MDEIAGRGFGLIIAYVLPGGLLLIGFAPHSELIQHWLSNASSDSSGIAGFLFLISAATATGLIVNVLRWFFVDGFHERTGLPRPNWEDAKLNERIDAYSLLVEHHYRYYQFYGATFLALPVTYAIHRFGESSSVLNFGTDCAILLIEFIIAAGSRDSLRRYYERVTRLLGNVATERDTMTNGSHHPHAGGGAATITNPKAQPKETQVSTEQKAQQPTAPQQESKPPTS